MRFRACITGLALVLACRDKSGADKSTTKAAFFEDSARKAERAHVAKDTTSLHIECVILEDNFGDLAPALATRTRALCHVELPRLFLRSAVTDVQARQTGDKNLDEIACMQLFVSDAFKILARHPTEDLEIGELVAEYTRRCPDAAAKARARAGAQ